MENRVRTNEELAAELRALDYGFLEDRPTTTLALAEDAADRLERLDAMVWQMWKLLGSNSQEQAMSMLNHLVESRGTVAAPDALNLEQMQALRSIDWSDQRFRGSAPAFMRMTEEEQADALNQQAHQMLMREMEKLIEQYPGLTSGVKGDANKPREDS